VGMEKRETSRQMAEGVGWPDGMGGDGSRRHAGRGEGRAKWAFGCAELLVHPARPGAMFRACQCVRRREFGADSAVAGAPSYHRAGPWYPRTTGSGQVSEHHRPSHPDRQAGQGMTVMIGGCGDGEDGPGERVGS